MNEKGQKALGKRYPSEEASTYGKCNTDEKVAGNKGRLVSSAPVGNGSAGINVNKCTGVDGGLKRIGSDF